MRRRSTPLGNVMRLNEHQRREREDIVVAVVREVLADEEIVANDNFFAVGGDSILALKVISFVADRGLSIDVADVLEADCLAELALLAARAPTRPERLAMEPTRSAAASFMPNLEAPTSASSIRPASALQIGMVFLSEMAGPATGTYLGFYGFRVAPADLGALRVALGRLIDRHEALRSRIDLADHPVPTQIIFLHAPVEPEVVEPAPGTDVAGLLAAWRGRVTEEGIDVSTAPVLRCHVVMSDDVMWVSLATHHSIVDGWSFNRLVVDLLLLYDAALDGQVAELPPVPPRIAAEFVRLEREALNSPPAQSHWAHLVQSDWPSVKGVRTEVPSATQRVAAELSLDVWSGLERAAAALRVPIKSLCLAAHARALGRIQGITELATGLVTNGRPEVDGADRIVGLFLNTVPLVLPTEGAWPELARAALDAERAMVPHRWYPLAAMTSAHGGPLFDVTFNFTHFHVIRELDGLRRTMVDSWWTKDVATFPCMVNVFAEDPMMGTGATVSYDPDLVEAGHARKILGEIESGLLEASRLTLGLLRYG